MKKQLLSIAIFTALLCGCSDDDTSSNQPIIFDEVVTALGGEDALRELTQFQVDASGNRWTSFEAPKPDGLMEASTYSATYMFDLSSDNLRVDGLRTPLFEGMALFGESPYRIVLNGDIGAQSEQVGFIPPGNMTSQAVGALNTQQRLFNPHIYIREALLDNSLIKNGTDISINGRPHHVLIFSGKHAEISFFVDEETYLISKLETTENHPLVRDNATEVVYTEWTDQSGIKFPQKIELIAGDLTVQEETRSAINTNPNFDTGVFDLPATADNPMVDETALSFGEQSHQCVEAFFQMGFQYSERPEIAISEIVPGISLLSGAMANSLAVSYNDGVIVLEAPASPKHGDNLIAEISTLFPNKSITHIIQSHHHKDHAAGVRSFVASGATLVVGHGIGNFWRNEILTAQSTIRPDNLSTMNSALGEVEEIDANGTFVIDDGTVKVTAYHIPSNTHADDMLLTVVDLDSARYVFVSDLYNAGFGFTVVQGGPEAFFNNMRALNIIDDECESTVPLTIIPAHGVPTTLEGAIAELSGVGINVGCP